MCHKVSFDTVRSKRMLMLMEPIPQGLRERKKLQTRKNLARSAIRLFEERGYANTTVEEIAAAANVSRRTFFRYFKSKDEVVIVDPEGKLAAVHVALAEGPPDEPTLEALKRGMLALVEAYWDPELSRSIVALMAREPEALAAARIYQMRFADVLSLELGVDMGVDERLDPRPRILAHMTISLARSAIAGWLLNPGEPDLTPVVRAERAFELGRPAMEAILAMPVEASATSSEAAAGAA